MGSWAGSASFVLFSALFGCVFGFGIAAFIQGIKNKRREANRHKDKQKSE